MATEGGKRPAAGRRLRLLHMAHIYWYNAEVQYAMDLAREMKQRGHSISFLGLTGSPGVERARQASLATYEECGFNAKGVRGLAAAAATVRLWSLLKRRKYDALVVHRAEGLPLIALAGRAAGVPVVRVRGDMRPVRRDPFNRWIHRRVLSGVVASNTEIEGMLVDRVGAIPRLSTIPGGVDAELFCPLGPREKVRNEMGFPEDAFLVGILGRLDPVKAQTDFLTAARAVVNRVPGAHFVVLVKEPSPYERDLRRYVLEHPELQGRVGFLGHRRDLPSVLRSFDLGVVASVGSEANCRVGLEWMASGVPLLATRVGVLPDIVADGSTGLLVSPGDPDGLARGVIDLAENPDRPVAMGAAARERVRSRFTLAQCARAHEDFLKSIVDCSRGSSTDDKDQAATIAGRQGRV